jgi:putative membrane protein
MKSTAIILLAFSGLIHIYIFLMESIWWGTPKVNKAFGVSAADAITLKGFAFNQGYYNLFLAIEIFLGIALWLSASPTIGAALAGFAAASMVCAALILIYSSPQLLRAAAIQGAAPLLALIILCYLTKVQAL